MEPTLETIQAALASISPDLPRDEWVRVAMALKSELDEGGLELFEAWSQRGETFNAKAARDTWRSVKASGAVTIGTLFHLAQQRGGFRLDVQTPAMAGEAREALASERRAAATREQAARTVRQDEASAEAARRWDAASEAGESPYLARKGVKPYGVRFGAGGDLLVPMRDAAGRLWNIQTIKPVTPADGAPEKLFLAGGRKTGTFHLIGEPDGAAWLLVAEGYATAASIHEATGRPVAVAWDAGNLTQVVRVCCRRPKTEPFLRAVPIQD